MITGIRIPLYILFFQESYFKLISPQILKLLSMEDTSETKTYHMIAAACTRSLTERSLILTRRYLLGSLMEPLSKLCQDEIAGADCQEVVTEEELVKGPFMNDIIISVATVTSC